MNQRRAGEAGGKLAVEELDEGARLGDGVHRSLGLGVTGCGLADEGEEGDHDNGRDRHGDEQLDHGEAFDLRNVDERPAPNVD